MAKYMLNTIYFYTYNTDVIIVTALARYYWLNKIMLMICNKCFDNIIYILTL